MSVALAQWTSWFMGRRPIMVSVVIDVRLPPNPSSA
jgi:hypothetical protein